MSTARPAMACLRSYWRGRRATLAFLPCSVAWPRGHFWAFFCNPNPLFRVIWHPCKVLLSLLTRMCPIPNFVLVFKITHHHKLPNSILKPWLCCGVGGSRPANWGRPPDAQVSGGSSGVLADCDHRACRARGGKQPLATPVLKRKPGGWTRSHFCGSLPAPRGRWAHLWFSG